MLLKYTLIILLLILSCDKNASQADKMGKETVTDSLDLNKDYRADMRNFVIGISEYAKSKNPAFAIIPQNGIELLTDTGYADGKPIMPYLEAIDGNGQENLFYGYTGDNKSTSKSTNEYLVGLLQVSQKVGNTILVIDYCSSEDQIEDSYQQNQELGFVSFAATERNLNNIPKLPEGVGFENNNDIIDLSEAKNFLFFLNYENYETKPSLINALSMTNHDALFLDLFANDGYVFNADDINRLKIKANGGKRLVICYMSIGEAEDYRYYWNSDWANTPPSWLDEENENWPGNYKVKYWDSDWQGIIMGSEASYLDKILTSDFDGVYLDIIDGFEYYENL